MKQVQGFFVSDRFVGVERLKLQCLRYRVGFKGWLLAYFSVSLNPLRNVNFTYSIVAQEGTRFLPCQS